MKKATKPVDLLRAWSQIGAVVVRSREQADLGLVAKGPRGRRRAAKKLRHRANEARRRVVQERVAMLAINEHGLYIAPRAEQLAPVDRLLRRLG